MLKKSGKKCTMRVGTMHYHNVRYTLTTLPYKVCRKRKRPARRPRAPSRSWKCPLTRPTKPSPRYLPGNIKRRISCCTTSSKNQVCLFYFRLDIISPCIVIIYPKIYIKYEAKFCVLPLDFCICSANCSPP